MNIYLIERRGDVGYDEHDGFVIAADDAKEARTIAAECVCPTKLNPAVTVTKELLEHRASERRLWTENAHSAIEKVGTYTGPRKTAHIILDSFIAG